MSATSHRRSSASRLAPLALLTLCAALLLCASSAQAAAPPTLWTACNGGEADSQCAFPRGVAANPLTGRVYVADQGLAPVNSRVVEFSALGEFVKTWGWDVIASGPGDDTIAPEDEFEICVPENGDLCKASINGAGIGQLSAPQGIALDSAGAVYVADFFNRRVQKFDAEGNFQLMIGGEVNETSGGNVCPRPGFPADLCKAAIAASGAGDPGEFGTWAVGSFIAVDDNGTASDADDLLYVGDQNRIQAFNTNGVYHGEFSVPGTVAGLAVDAAGDLYAIYAGAIHKLSPAGEPLPPAFKLEVEGFPGTTKVVAPTAVAVDAAGDVYAFGLPKVEGFERDPIFQFDSAGEQIDNFGKGEYSFSTGLATNLCAGSESPGNVYATNGSESKPFLRAYGTAPLGCLSVVTGQATEIEEFAATLGGAVNPKGLAVSECLFQYGTSTSYGQTASCEDPDASEIGTGIDLVPVHADLGGLEKGTVYHFRLLANLGGANEAGLDATFKTLGPPVISADHTAGATQDEATLKALVNPEGFPTTYRFEYGLTVSYGQSTPQISAGKDRTDRPVLAVLEGLAPGTTYHWRIVASNSSGTSEGEDHTVTTYRVPDPAETCPNQALRTGTSAFLPDCRAYEMVSPVDKNGGDITAGTEGYVQASRDGNKVTYTAVPSYADQPNAFAVNQYLAGREAGEGWSNQGIYVPVLGKLTGFVPGLSNYFSAFSPDLCSAWLSDIQTPPATAEGQEGRGNSYRRLNCGADGLEALVPNPPSIPPAEATRILQGVSEDSRHALFVANEALPHTPEANNGTNLQIYDRFCPIAPNDVCRADTPGSAIRLVSVLPSGDAVAVDTELGSGDPKNLENAVSTDGSRVYWTSGLLGTGKIYLRQHPEQGKVEGECESPAAACTVLVTDGGLRGAFFWAGSADGSGVLYGETGEGGEKLWLQEFEASETKKLPETKLARRLVAEHVKGVLGASDDLARIYFVSPDKLTGAQQNSQGDEAQIGQPNLYLDQEGTLSFVATLLAGDVGAKEPSALSVAYNLVGKSHSERPTRVTPDGAHIAFQSRAPLTGFDNTDSASGKPAVEVFVYAAGGELLCVSCNPSGSSPHTRGLGTPYVPFRLGTAENTGVIAAAWIPTWENPLHASNLLSADGARLFFNSNDALLPRDANGAQDVYQWEAPGTGGCDTKDAQYFASNGGCLYLISTGESPFESEFWEASSDGRDVFFTTESSLLPQDPGLIDLYDARVGGGFPQPTVVAACEGEACQSPPPPPDRLTPATSALSGDGNVVAPKAKECPQGKRRVKRKGRVRCVPRKRRAAKHRRRANRNRRATR